MSTTAKEKVSFQSTPSIEELKQTKSNFITRSSSFKRLCAYVFSICDANSTGSINATELYAGVLLVHLNLAKYAGPAACFPASRQVVDKLFEASDDDKSGGIDAAEFETIMVSD
jgi:Ca2+-binding EF-hand superfamily protein